VQRDPKPANVVLTADGPRLIDFGVARTGRGRRYRFGEVADSPDFVSPEQVPGSPVGTASDIM
jgi:serine/threonine protein kinase